MNLLKLGLNNFRSYKQAILAFGPGLTTIVGENNVGKSSLLAALQAIRLAGGLTAEDWPYENNAGPMSVKVELRLSQIEIAKFCSELEIPEGGSSFLGRELAIRIDWERQNAQILPVANLGPLRMFWNGTASLDNQDSQSGYMTITWSEVLRAWKGTSGSIWEIAGSRAQELSARAPGTGVRIEFTKNPLVAMSTILQEKIVIFPEFRQRPQGGAATEEVQSPEGTQVPAVLFNLKNSAKKIQRGRFVEIQRFFTSLFPTLRLEVVKGPHVLVERASTGREIPLNRIGAGIAQMITLLTHLVGSEDMIFAIDSPELHLHPHSQRLLRNVLQGSTKNQVLVVSHSPEFVNFSDPIGILLVRQVDGQSSVIQLPNDYLSDKEKAGMSKMVWSEDKDFLFSRRVLLVEGPTEYAAIPILANRLGHNLDENGVSVIEVGGDYFGLFLKLLKGFGFPLLVMCDEDALMTIGKGKIETGTRKIRTSPLFYAIWRTGLLKEGDLAQLIKAENSITITQSNGKNVVRYDENESGLLENLVNKYGFRILSPNFEGFLLRKGFRNLLRDADKKYHKDKVLQGRYVATKMEKIPHELKEIIAEVSSLK
jgi:hypothetical protein